MKLATNTKLVVREYQDNIYAFLPEIIRVDGAIQSTKLLRQYDSIFFLDENLNFYNSFSIEEKNKFMTTNLNNQIGYVRGETHIIEPDINNCIKKAGNIIIFQSIKEINHAYKIKRQLEKLSNIIREGKLNGSNRKSTS